MLDFFAIVLLDLKSESLPLPLFSPELLLGREKFLLCSFLSPPPKLKAANLDVSECPPELDDEEFDVLVVFNEDAVAEPPDAEPEATEELAAPPALSWLSSPL